MKEYLLSGNKKILIYDLHEALTHAGVNETDNEFAKDAALSECFEGQRVTRIVWNPSTYNEELTCAVSEGYDVILVDKSV